MDRSDSLYISLIITGFVVSIGGMALLYPVLVDDAVAANMTDTPYHYTVSGERQVVHPSTFYRVCLGYDCVPALYDTHVSFTSVEEADDWLSNGDLVISMELDGETYGIPLRLMQHHFVANMVVEDQPITVTYDPFSAHHAVYSRTISEDNGFAGSTLSFGVTGQLWNGNLVMVDRETGSYWSQYRGEAIYGDKTMTQLDQIDTHIARWSLWHQQHEDSLVLDRPNHIYDAVQYADNPYMHYRNTRQVPVDDYDYDYDGPMHQKTVIYGIIHDGQEKAFTESSIQGSWPVQATVGGVPILLVQDESTGAVHGYDRRVNGDTLDFKRVNRQLQDTAGTTWTATGTAINGTLTGETLAPLTLTRMYWFSWNLFHPDTDHPH